MGSNLVLKIISIAFQNLLVRMCLLSLNITYLVVGFFYQLCKLYVASASFEAALDCGIPSSIWT